MKNISLWKKIKLYFYFRKVLKNNKEELFTGFSAKVDNVSRIYTVLNIPEDIIKEKEPFTAALSKKYIENYTLSISQFLTRKGVMELCKFYTVEQIEQYNYLIIIGFKFFDTQKVAKNLLFKVLPTILIILSIFLFISKNKHSIEF